MKRRDLLKSAGMAVPAGVVGLWAAERFPPEIYGKVDLGPAANEIDPELCAERLLNSKILDMQSALDRQASEFMTEYKGIDRSTYSWWRNESVP